MQFLSILFIAILIFWFLGQLLHRLLPYLLRRYARKHMEKTFGQFFTSEQPKDHKKSRQPEPHNPSKKIDASVGEYVRFEEIEVTEQTRTTVNPDGSTNTKTHFKIEEQIVDAEWEDIPEE